MLFLRHDHFGPPSEALQLIEEPDPTPGPQQVVIAVEATPVHYGDLKSIEGIAIMPDNFDQQGDPKNTLPKIPGVEGIGHIASVGTDVDLWKEGDRVFLPFVSGTWRDYLVADAVALISAPKGDAAPLALLANRLTAHLALEDLIDVKPGQWILQNMANSDVGLCIARLAKRRGVKTVNVVRRNQLISVVEEAGGDAVIVDGPDLAERVAKATAGATLSIGFDGVGGDATMRIACCLMPGGKLINYGQISGEMCRISGPLMWYNNISLRGYYMGHNLLTRSSDDQRRIIDEVATLVAEDVLPSRIARRYPLQDFKKAVNHAAETGESRDGKVIFTPHSTQ